MVLVPPTPPLRAPVILAALLKTKLLFPAPPVILANPLKATPAAFPVFEAVMLKVVPVAGPIRLLAAFVPASTDWMLEKPFAIPVKLDVARLSVIEFVTAVSSIVFVPVPPVIVPARDAPAENTKELVPLPPLRLAVALGATILKIFGPPIALTVSGMLPVIVAPLNPTVAALIVNVFAPAVPLRKRLSMPGPATRLVFTANPFSVMPSFPV